MWTDQKWFLDHPGTKEYWRQVKACDFQSKTLEHIVWEDGKIPKMRVSHVTQGVSIRHLSEVEPHAITMMPPDFLRDPESAAPMRWFMKLSPDLPVIWKPTPENFQLNFPECESPVEQMFFDAICHQRVVEFAYLFPQFPITLNGQKYRLDFADNSRKLCIEIDGLAHHDGQEAFMRDRSRERDLLMDGWKVLRFAAKEVMIDADKCVRQAVEWAENV
jgi:very-short-patch-repair endonuclease